MAKDTWRNAARATLDDVFKQLPADATEKEVRKAIHDAYPFGERAMHPYKIWCDESRRWLEARFPKMKRANDLKKLQREIEKRGGNAVAQMPQLFEVTE